MKLSRSLPLCLLLAFALPTLAASPLCETGECQALVTQTTYFGRAAYKLSDGRSEAVIVPEIGRVMRYGLVKGPNLLWNAPTEKGLDIGGWKSYGGDKNWLGPQSYWPLWNKAGWPPDKAFDGSPHEAEILSGGILRLTSPLSESTGIRIARDFSFDVNGDLVITQTARKWRGEPIRASIWSITQIVPGEAIFLPLDANSPYKKNFHWLGTPKDDVEIKPITSTLLQVTPSTSAKGGFKIGVDAPVSSILSVRDQVAFLQRSNKPKGQYPDGADGAGFPVELYLNGDYPRAYYAELEILSPLLDFRAGSRWIHTVRWSIHALPSPDLEAPETIRTIDALLRSTEGLSAPIQK